MSFELHEPVLFQNVLDMAAGVENPSLFLDGTFGRGGHAIGLMERFEGLRVCALDQDLAAIEYANTQYSTQIEQGRLQVLHGSFHDAKDLCSGFSNFNEGQGFDLILLDLGVSSPQLDEAERGFSFQKDGPLDMRMNREQDLTAADIVNNWTEDELKDLFYELGEVRKPGRVVSEILKRRQAKPFKTTLDLSDLIAATDGWRRKGWHPATQYFLALRMEVNQELAPLAEALTDLKDLLAEGGRMMVITFHSLEDRIVKQTFKSLLNEGELVNKKVIQATWGEKKKNPRARSAKLRGFQRVKTQAEGESHE